MYDGVFAQVYGQEFLEQVKEAMGQKDPIRSMAYAVYLTEIIQALYYKNQKSKVTLCQRYLGLPGLRIHEDKAENLLTIPDMYYLRPDFSKITRDIQLFLGEPKVQGLVAVTINILPAYIQSLLGVSQGITFEGFSRGDVEAYVRAHNSAVKAHHGATSQSQYAWRGEGEAKKIALARYLGAVECKVYAALVYLHGNPETGGDMVMGDVMAFTGISASACTEAMVSLHEKGFINKPPRSPYRSVKIPMPMLSWEDSKVFAEPTFWDKGLTRLSWQEARLYVTLQGAATGRDLEGRRVVQGITDSDLGQRAFARNLVKGGGGQTSDAFSRLTWRGLISRDKSQSPAATIILAEHPAGEVYANVVPGDAWAVAADSKGKLLLGGDEFGIEEEMDNALFPGASAQEPQEGDGESCLPAHVQAIIDHAQANHLSYEILYRRDGGIRSVRVSFPEAPL